MSLSRFHPMPAKVEGKPSCQDLIDDIVEPSPSAFHAVLSSSFIDGSRAAPANRTYASYSNLPSLFNSGSTKSKFDPLEHLAGGLLNDARDRFQQLALPRSNSSSLMLNGDERRKELDLLLKHLYGGKMLPSINDERPTSDISDASTRRVTATNSDDESRTVRNTDVSARPFSRRLNQYYFTISVHSLSSRPRSTVT